MPLTGFADVPISPQIRDDTVTKRNPKITTNSDATMFSKPEVRAPAIGLNVSISHIATMIASEPSTTQRIEMSLLQPSAGLARQSAATGCLSCRCAAR